MKQTLSQFHFYSKGVVAKNKELDSKTIYALPIEIVNFVDGELNSLLEEKIESGEDKYGNEYYVKVKTDNAVEAKWLPTTNRRTAPDVRRGERVILFRHSDSDELYWQSEGMDDHLRKLETLVWSWSDTQDENKDSTDPANAYSLEISTHTKQITLKTVKENGESFAYTIQINTNDGRIVVTDDVNNYIELDSAKTKITLHNKDTTKIVLDKKNIFHYAPDSIHSKAVKDITFKCTNFTVDASKDFTVKAGKTVSLKAGADASVEGTTSALLKCGASSIALGPSSAVIKSPSISVKEV